MNSSEIITKSLILGSMAYVAYFLVDAILINRPQQKAFAAEMLSDRIDTSQLRDGNDFLLVDTGKRGDFWNSANAYVMQSTDKEFDANAYNPALPIYRDSHYTVITPPQHRINYEM